MNKPIVLIGVVLIAFALWMSITTNPFFHSIVTRIDNASYDFQLRLRLAAYPKTPKTPIVIVDIDDKSVQAEGLWPWPRKKIASLVDKLKAHDVNLIIFDMFFAAKAPNVANKLLDQFNQTTVFDSSCRSSIQAASVFTDEDLPFAKSMASGKVFLGFAFLPYSLIANDLPSPLLQLTPDAVSQLNLYHAKGYLANIGILQQAAKGVGFMNVVPDSQDGIVRRAHLIMEYNGGIYPALSLQTMLHFYGDKLTLDTPLYGKNMKLERLRLGKMTIPTDKAGQVFIPFIGGSRTFKYYSATDVLNDRLPPDTFAGKMVLIGSTAVGLGDIHATAVSGQFYGVEIQATLLNGMLENNFSYQPAWIDTANLSFILILGLIAVFVLPKLGARTLTIAVFAIPILLTLINEWIWEKTGLLFSFTIPIILVFLITLFNIVYQYLFETRKRMKLKAAFGQYVPDEHIDEMLSESGNFAFGAEDKEMSVMFADIRNFTTISEKMSAQDLVGILNSYLSVMTKIIFSNHGTIDKYQGDNIMAFWGAPKKDPDHANHAMLAALSMQETLANMRATSTEDYWKKIHIGIGINTGLMSVGDMGSTYRRNYTVLGDAVNLGSRAEGLTKFYGVAIIVTEYTQKGNDAFIFRKLDTVRVKGKTISVVLYELVCLKKDITTELNDEIKIYHQALDLYSQQQWDEALKIIETLHSKYPDTVLYKIYLKRIKEYKKNPPPTAWDGVYEHLSK
jgi:adenylate cyclase